MCMPTTLYDGVFAFQIKVCETCQHTERNKNMARIIRPIKVDGPWEVIAVEILGNI